MVKCASSKKDSRNAAVFHDAAIFVKSFDPLIASVLCDMISFRRQRTIHSKFSIGLEMNQKFSALSVVADLHIIVNTLPVRLI